MDARRAQLKEEHEREIKEQEDRDRINQIMKKEASLRKRCLQVSNRAQMVRRMSN